MCQADRPQEVLLQTAEPRGRCWGTAGEAAARSNGIPYGQVPVAPLLIQFPEKAVEDHRIAWTPANPVGDPEAALAMQPSETHWMEDSLNVQFFQIRKKKKQSKFRKISRTSSTPVLKPRLGASKHGTQLPLLSWDSQHRDVRSSLVQLT